MILFLSLAVVARGEDYVFPAVAASGWTGSAAVRVDARDTLGGRIVHGIESRGEPDGSTNRLWDTTALEDGWHRIEAGSGDITDIADIADINIGNIGDVGNTADVLSINAPSIAVEGGRLKSDAFWTSNATHLVRHWVVVPSGVTLTIATNTVVKLVPGAGIRVEDGGALRFVGAAGAEAVVTTCDDDAAGAQLPGGSPEGLAPPYGAVGGVTKQSSSATVSDNTHVRFTFSSSIFPTVSIQDASAKRSDGVARIPVTVSGTARDTAFRVDWRAVDGSAVYGEDYLLASGTLSWTKSSDGTRHIEIPLDTETLRGSNTAFRVELAAHYACNVSRTSAEVVVREFDFPGLVCSDWTGSAAIRFDGREGIAGAVATGVERLGEPDGSTNRLWDTTALADGWHTVESTAVDPPEERNLLVLNPPPIENPVEGPELLAFIQSSGTEWIDSGYRPGPETRVQTLFQFLERTEQGRVFGVESGTLFFSIYQNGNGYWAYAFRNNSGNWISTSKSTDTVPHLFDFNVAENGGRSLTIDNGGVYRSTLSGSPSQTASYPLAIGGSIRDGGLANYFSKHRIYWMRIYEGDELVRDFVPAVWNGATGLWDRVESSFHGNAGVGGYVGIPATAAFAVEGGRLAASAVWGTGATHLVRHTVVVPSGMTLSILPGAVVKFLPGTFIKVEDGGALSVLGEPGNDAIFTSAADDRFGAAIDCGDFLDFKVAPSNNIGGIVLQSSAATFTDNAYLQIHSFKYGAYPYVKMNDTVAFRDGGMAYVPVSIASGTRNQAFSIDWEAVDGTARLGEDYTLASGTIEWTGTSQGTKTLEIPLVADNVRGETTSFKLRIKVCRACNPSGTGECTVSIRELDKISFAAATASSAPVRFDSRESIGGRIVHGIEPRGEPDGSAATTWDTAALADGWHAIESGGESAELLSINDPAIAVEGGRLASDTVWDDSKTHLVRHWVVVPSGRTLTVERGTVVKICPDAGIRVEDGGKLVVNGVDGADAIFTTIDDPVESEQSVDGDDEEPASTLLAHYTFSRANLLEAKVGSNAKESSGRGTVSYSDSAQNLARVEDTAVLSGRAGAVSVPVGTGFSVPVPADADGANWALAMDFYVPGGVGSWRTFFSLSQANTADGALFIRNTDGQVGQGTYQAFSNLFGTWHQLAVSTENGTSAYWIDGEKASLSKNWTLTPGGWLHLSLDNDGEDGEMLIGQVRLYGEAKPAELFPDGVSAIVLPPVPDDGTPVVSIQSLKSSVSKGTRLAVRIADAGGSTCALRAVVSDSVGSRIVSLSAAAASGLHEFDLGSLLELQPGTTYSVFVEAENASAGKTAQTVSRTVLVPVPSDGIDWTELDAGTPGGIVILPSGTFQDNGWFQLRGVSCNASNIGALSIHNAEVSRKAGMAYVGVTVSGNTRNQSFTADWEAVPGTATWGNDYKVASGRLTWSKSSEGTKWIAIPINKKTEAGARRTFKVRLRIVRGMTGTGGEATVEVREYDEGALDADEVAFFPEGEGSEPFVVDEPIWKEPIFRHATEPIRLSGAWQGLADPAETAVRLSWEGENGSGVLAEVPGSEPSTYEWRAEDWEVGSYVLRHDVLDASGKRLSTYEKTFAVPSWDGVELHGGTLTSNETWRAGIVHVVYETVYVPALYTIKLEPGAIVKFLTGTGITIEAGGGALFANGVVFTHINDDTVGGDTLNDGNTLVPVEDAYAFKGELTIGDESELRYKTQALLSGTISGSRKLTRGSTYRVSGNVTIASGATLVIPAGTILKFDAGVQMTVNSGGTLFSEGTRAAPVVFTSVKDDEFGGDTNGDGDATGPDLGDWARVEIAGTAEFDYTRIRYASPVSDKGAINGTGSGRVRFDNGVIECALYECVRMNGSSSFASANSIFRVAGMGFGYYGGTGVWVTNAVLDRLAIGSRANNKHFVNTVFHDCDKFRDGGNTTYDHCLFWNDPDDPVMEHSFSVVGSNGNRWGDPMFRDADAGDYRIREGSACIDAADSEAAPAKDSFGQRRWDFPAIANADAGAADAGVAECVPRDAAGDVDLVATSAKMSWSRETVKPGDAPYFFWTVANQGGEDVETDWWDEIALVSVASGRIATLGEYNQTKGVSAGGTTTGAKYFEIPPLAEGDYRIRLNANARRSDVPEGSRTENNVLVADALVRVEVATEDATVGAAGMVGRGGRVVRKFDVAEGAGALLAHVSAPSGSVLRYGLGFMPGEGSASGEIALEDGIGVFAVPEGTAAVYVVLESGAEGPFDIVFLDGSLAVASVSPAQVPRSGRVTLRVAGAGFADGCAAALVAPSGAVVAPERVVRTSAEELWATVDCAALAAAGASFALRAETPDGGEAALEGAVAVTAAEGRGGLWAELDHSNLETARRGAFKTGRIRYGNAGNVDIPAPILQVTVDGGGELGYVDGRRGFSAIQFVGAGGSGVAGVLRPGEERAISFRFWPGADGSVYLYASDGQIWFESPWTSLADQLSDFSSAATRIARRGQDPTDYELVRDLALAVKRGEPTSVAVGRVVDETGKGVEGVFVSFADTNAVAAASAATDATGRFVSTVLAPGEYAVQFLAGIAVEWPGTVVIDGSTDIDLGVVAVANAVSGITRFTGTIPVGTTVRASSLESGLVAQADWTDNTTAVFRGLPDGWYHVEAVGQIAAADGVLRVGGESVQEIKLEMLPAGTISGTIAELADPLELGVIVVGRNGSVRVAYADENGEFSVSGLPPGAYSVQVVGNGADAYEATDEIELAAGGSEEVFFAPIQSRPNSVPSLSPAASLRSSDYVPGSNLWFWHYWGIRDDLKESIERGRTALNSTSVFDPWTCECEHNRAKFASDTAVYNKLDRVVVRMEALEARADRGYFAPIWKNAVNAVQNTIRSAKEFQIMFSPALDQNTKDELMGYVDTAASVVEYFEGLDYGAGDYTGQTVAFLKNQLIPDVRKIADDYKTLSSAGIGGAFSALSACSDAGRLDPMIDYIDALTGLYDEAGKVAGLAKKGANFGQYLAPEHAAELAVVKSMGDTYESVANYLAPVIHYLKGVADLLRTEQAWEDGYAGWMDGRREMEVALARFDAAYADFQRKSQSFNLYHWNCPDDEYDIPLFEDEVDKVTPSIPQSVDPNEVVGPAGLGDPETERFVAPGEWLDFTIYFENATNATAAARTVKIVEDLDPLLDWTSLTLGEVVFANETDRGLSGLASGTSEYAVPGTNYLVRTTFTQHNGLATWSLRLVDPDGDEDGWPLDEWMANYGGFLPPNDTNHVGEGHVSYRIRVRDDAPKNARIATAAKITFDSHETIPTDPSWWNTVGHPAVSLSFDRNCDDAVLSMPADGPYACDAPEFGTPVREGWFFLGWADTNGIARNCGADLPYGTAALDLFAQWKEVVEAKFVTISVDGGVLIAGLADGEACPEDLVIPPTLEIGGRRVKVVGVADDAFKGKRAIKTLTVAEGVRSIGARAFMNCTALASASLPSTLESIGENAFYGCRLLDSVTVAAATPPALGGDAFRSVAATGVLRVPEGSEEAYAAWIGADLGSAWTVEGYDPGLPPDPGEPAWTLLLAQNRLVYAAGATDVRWTIDVSVAADGGVTLLRASTTDERGAALELPDPVLDEEGAEHRIVAIGANADITEEGVFEGLDLGSVSIPESVVSVAPCAFANCAELAEVLFAGDVPALQSLGAGAFFGCTALRTIGMEALFGLTRLGSADDALGVFESCWNLREAVLPCYVGEIGAFAFQDCSRLESVTFDAFDGARIRAIGKRAFYNCDSLVDVNWDSLLGLEGLGEAALGGDTAATAPKVASLVLHRDFASLGDGALINAGALAEITCFAEVPPARGENAFLGVARTGVLRVPAAVAEDYTNQTARAWIGPEAGKLPPWNGTSGWTVEYLDASDELRRREGHLTDEEFAAFLSLADLLGFTEAELCGVEHPAEALVPVLQIVAFDRDAATFPVSILFENGIDETPRAALERLRAKSRDRIVAVVSDELGGEERRIVVQGQADADGSFHVYLGTTFDKAAPAQFVRIVIEGD